MVYFQATLSGIVFITLIATVYYSLRYRREREPLLRGLYSARMNIVMGIMLIVISITQLFFLTDSVARRIFGTVCLLLGVFNLFTGLRNHGHFTRLISSTGAPSSEAAPDRQDQR